MFLYCSARRRKGLPVVVLLASGMALFFVFLPISFTVGFTPAVVPPPPPPLPSSNRLVPSRRRSNVHCRLLMTQNHDDEDITSLQSLQQILQRLRVDLTKENQLMKENNNKKKKKKGNNNNKEKDDEKKKKDTTILQLSIADINNQKRQHKRNLSSDELAREQILSSRIEFESFATTTTTTINLNLTCCTIGPSTIKDAGRGLFATRNIVENEIITCYPGDGILYLPSNANDDVDEIILWGTHVPNNYRWEYDAVFDGIPSSSDANDVNDNDSDDDKKNKKKSSKGRPLVDYALYVNDMYTILGNPLLDSNPAYMGHFANDYGGYYALNGFRMDDNDENDGDGDDNDVEEEEDIMDDDFIGNYVKESIITIEESLATYVNESMKMANAQHSIVDDSHMVTIATKNITKGDEIFVTYGIEYWMEYNNFDW